MKGVKHAGSSTGTHLSPHTEVTPKRFQIGEKPVAPHPVAQRRNEPRWRVRLPNRAIPSLNPWEIQNRGWAHWIPSGEYVDCRHHQYEVWPAALAPV
jgi:hypothetical protein